MKRRNMPQDLVSMAERHTNERCEMNRRQFQERKAVMEQLRQQGVQVEADEGLIDDGI